MNKYSAVHRGFSLVGLTVTVTVLVLLLTAALTFFNPRKQLDMDNNSRRYSDLLILSNAVVMYSYDHGGNLPGGISIINKEISARGVDLCKTMIPQYIVNMPSDPSLGFQQTPLPCALDYKTHYFIVLNSDNTITVSAPDTAVPPADKIINVTRKVMKQ